MCVCVQFHASSDTHISTVLSKNEHTILCARAAASPLFVLPLSTAPGRFHTLLLQWQPPHRLLFTTLEEFKQWGPQAPPHLTVQLYEELKDSHALVLARGDLLSTQLIGAAQVGIQTRICSTVQQRDHWPPFTRTQGTCLTPSAAACVLLPQGRTLLELARAFYRDAAAYRMVYAFNHNPQQFDFQQLCRELGVSLPGAAGGSPSA